MNETLTTSSLMNFKDCQKFFYFEDALKLQGKQDPFFQFTLELMDLVKAAVASNDSTLVEAKFKEVAPEWFVLAKEMEERVGFLHTAVSRYLKYEFGRQVKNVKTDVLYTVSRIVNGKEYSFSGKVDRIIETEDGYEAIKYKLGSPSLTSAARTPQNLPINCLELALCYAGLREQYPGIRISYYHLRHKDDKSTEPVPVFNDKPNKNIVTAVFNDELCEATLQQLNEIDLEKMKAVMDESEYSKGEGCENCKYHMLESRPAPTLGHVESAIPKSSKAARLNKKQKEAVERLYGSTRVLAPAGSGKSTVLVMKVVELLKRDVSHKNILLMTFTNKAAEELKERISAATGIAEKELEIYTYNSFCFNVLKRYREFLGMDNITMIKKSDRYNFIREFLEANPIEGVSYSNPYNPNYGIIAELDKTTTTLIDKNLLDAPVEEIMALLRNSKKEYIEYCLRVAKHIRQRMAELGLINYSDQIRLVNKLFTMNPNLSKVLSYQYQFLMLDEYQDSATRY